MIELIELALKPVAIILGLLSPFIAYLFGGKMAQKAALKKSNADARQTDADANSAIAEAYRKFVVDHNIQMENLKNEISELRSSNMAISAKQTDILLLYSKEQKKSYDLEKLNLELTRKHDKLQQDFDALQAKIKLTE